MRIEGAMSDETKWVKNPAYDALGPENDVYVDSRFTHKGPATRAAEHTLQNMKNEPLPKEWEEFGEIPIGIPQATVKSVLEWMKEASKKADDVQKYARIGRKRNPEISFVSWSYNIRGTSTDTRPTNITEGAD